MCERAPLNCFFKRKTEDRPDAVASKETVAIIATRRAAAVLTFLIVKTMPLLRFALPQVDRCKTGPTSCAAQ